MYGAAEATARMSILQWDDLKANLIVSEATN